MTLFLILGVMPLGLQDFAQEEQLSQKTFVDFILGQPDAAKSRRNFAAFHT
ncbi:MAG: hypothetical protein JXQ81_11130 [Desulfuromonadales bacterium]|nr:hypothetical protein [Desulfuromonadales bacterium]